MTSLRDPRQSEEHYRARLAALDGEVDRYREFVENAARDDRAPEAAYIRRALDIADQRLTLSYALGLPVAQLTQEVRALGSLWRDLYLPIGDRWQQTAWARGLIPMARNASWASFAVNAVSWASVLGEREVVEQVLATHHVQQMGLPVIGHLARFVGVDAPVDGALSHAKLWQPWIEVVESDDDGRQTAFERFVTTYPTGLKTVRRLVPPTDASYPGQFAFEAAPLAIHFGLDDAAVRDLPDYPTDLVDYGRSLR